MDHNTNHIVCNCNPNQLLHMSIAIHECHETCHSVTFIVLVNSHQRWKQTRNRVCFQLWCELTLALWCHSIVRSLFYEIKCNGMTSFMEFMNNLQIFWPLKCPPLHISAITSLFTVCPNSLSHPNFVYNTTFSIGCQQEFMSNSSQFYIHMSCVLWYLQSCIVRPSFCIKYRVSTRF